MANIGVVFPPTYWQTTGDDTTKLPWPFSGTHLGLLEKFGGAIQAILFLVVWYHRPISYRWKGV